MYVLVFFFSSRRRHTRLQGDWSSDVCSSDLFDVILVIIIGSIAARAVTGGTAFFPALLAVIALMFMHWLFSAVARDSTVLSNWIKGCSTLLIKNGQIIEPALRRAHMSRGDLDEGLREKGFENPSEVKQARLERNGRLSVIQK